MPTDISFSFMTGSVKLFIISAVEVKIERFLGLGSRDLGAVSSDADLSV